MALLYCNIAYGSAIAAIIGAGFKAGEKIGLAVLYNSIYFI